MITLDSEPAPSLSNLDYVYDSYFDKWDGYLIFNQSNTPIVDIFVGISPPCGQYDQLYAPRKGTNYLYLEGECEFTLNNSHFHPDYIRTDFNVSEYLVLKENKILDEIFPTVPYSVSTDFTINFF
mmetsp:Transcript_2297/g.2240  ORF Transcript_2297/g.2240 Transcript_2297/m.2240 type:complete len:125 (-) Transcript_2297:199-573(-)